MKVITDEQIKSFIQEKKVLRANFRPILREILGHARYKHSVRGEKGNIFDIHIRQNQRNPLDFSIIFGVSIRGNLFKIKRYNGNHPSPHTNRLENEIIRGFHVHEATERYQEKGYPEETFARKTDRYSDWRDALEVMLKDNNFIKEIDDAQHIL